MIRLIVAAQTDDRELETLLTRPPLDKVTPSPAVEARTAAIFGEKLMPEEAVRRILADVETQGDGAIEDYCDRIDGVRLSPDEFFVTEDEIKEAYVNTDRAVIEAIQKAVINVRRYHEGQIERSWFAEGPEGDIYGQRILPLERVGCYVPGGRAPLMSTVVMTVVPAKVAGVRDVVVATPCKSEGKVHPAVLVALKEAGADRVIKIGGAQAIAALAYGTETISKVDKIVGPGNLFVTLAKKAVFGRVGIDGLQGPSEVAIIADQTAAPQLVAADMIAQAEHDPEASAWLFTPDADLADKVRREIRVQLDNLDESLAQVAAESLERWGGIVLTQNLDQSIRWADVLAAEHVQLMVKDAWNVLPQVKFGGALFLGPFSPVPLGDYIAGPSHVLPTNGTARFASPLGVYDFVRRMSVVSYNEEAYREVADKAALLATMEGLQAHADSLKRRL